MLSARPRSLRQLLGLLALALVVPMTVLAVTVAVLQVRVERTRLEDQARAEARTLLQSAEREVAQGRVLLRRAMASGGATAGMAPLDGRHLALLAPDGTPRADSRPPGQPLPEAARAAALALVAAGGLVSPLVEDPASGGHALLLAEPTPDGILVLALPAARFRALFDDPALAPFDNVRFPALSDAEGRIVARWLDQDRFVGRPMPPEALAVVRTAPEGLWRGRSLDGQKVIVAHAASPLTGLAVGVGITEAALRQPYLRSALLFGPAALLLIGLAAWTTARVARRIGGPVAELGIAAAALAEGRPPPRLETAVAEVNAVAAAMAEAAQRRQAAEAQRDLLVRELHHRVKNLLTTAQSLATLSARTARDPAGFAAQFGGRLRALARTHTLLLEEPGGELSLATLMTEVLAPYRLGVGRIVASGPEVRLPGDTAVPLGMVLHELATNAAKYGALSIPDGRLQVAWRIEEDPAPRLELEWTERGGPALSGPPDREGFGSQLLRRALAGLPGGQADVAWRAEGLAVRLALKLPVPAATS